MAPLATLLAPALAGASVPVGIARPRVVAPDTPPPLPTPDDGRALVATILGSCPPLVYRDLVPNPYAPHAPLTYYADTDGNTYWIDHARRLVCKVDTDPRPFAPARAIAPEARRTVFELRELALGVARKLDARFDERLHRLHPFERRLSRERVVFRWEAMVPATSVGHVPLLQVSLDVDGQVRGVLHTLPYWPELTS